MEFVSIIPKVDKEVALSIINKFPNYVEMSKDMVGGMINYVTMPSKTQKMGEKKL
ncbi:MAG: hypothetical protein RR342_04625 [Bacilli bacterium]